MASDPSTSETRSKTRPGTRPENSSRAAVPTTAPSLRASAKRFLPWLFAAVLVGYVFTRVPLAEAWNVARGARLDLFAPLVGVAVVAWFLIDAYVYSFIFTRWNAPLSFTEARALRGMSYLLTPIHWNVGKAAIIMRLRQTKRIPVLESTSTIMLYQSVDGLILAIFATAGLTLLARDATPLGGARLATAAIILLILVNLALLRATRPNYSWLAWWRGTSIHHAHRQLTCGDLLRVAFLKGAYHLGFVLVYYFGARAFGIELPLALALAATPIIQAVGALPITPAGLGTQQAAMLYFFDGRFGGSGGDAAIVALGFSLPIALIAARCVIGLFCLRDLSRSARSGAVPATPTESPAIPCP